MKKTPYKSGKIYATRLDPDLENAIIEYMALNDIDTVALAMRQIMRQWMVYTKRKIESNRKEGMNEIGRI